MFLTIITFFIVLGVIVLVHEAGHFVVARKAGVKVEEFGLGIPPRIMGFYKDENGKWKTVGPKSKETTKTIWSLNWIPLGGFVKIKGEQGDSQSDPDSFANKSISARTAILTAGVTMNIILAIVLLSVGFIIGVPQIIDDTQTLPPLSRVSDRNIQVVNILPESPAANAGMQIADAIVAIDGQEFANIIGVQDYIGSQVGQAINIKLMRDQEIIDLELVPEILAETERGGVGAGLLETAIVSYPWYVAPWYGLIETFRMMIGVVIGFFLIIKSLVVGQGLIGEVYGPVGIATLVGDAARLGVLYLIQLTAALSIIIAVINYLPFPALDGGRVLFLIIEKLRGKPVNQRFEALMHNLGFALLMLLVLVVTFKDVARLSAGFANFWSQLGGIF